MKNVRLATMVAITIGIAAAPASAQSARDILTQASFAARSKAAALQGIAEAERLAAAALARAPEDREALLMQATARSYRAKINGSRADAIAARRMFETLAARAPRDPEPQLGLGAWHMGAVFKLGGMIGRAALGAQKSAGLSALDRAVAAGGDRAIYPGVAALLRLEQDAGDPKGRALAELASRAAAPTMFDRAMRKAAGLMLASIQAGNAAATKALAARLLPFGQIPD
ncbi:MULTISPECIES: hypothetical protein [unclassified Sphingomonas]|uniref:hypothetical protein n=1 Tax=unclassified Sphingomonas TaxID=196159 RepID=UPI0025E087C5|nr:MULTISPECIES: hypothetical protein [unclassified Sphingomonas]